ncbi:hypothetical protein KJ742_05815 [Patescibacteria group bacterium]|nr:hypothetical protein [Patescibacteria group bacterium]
MKKPKDAPSLDHVFIVDAFDPRAQEIEALARKHSSSVRVFSMDCQDFREVCGEFADALRVELEQRRNVMVCFGAVSGVRGGVVEALNQVEKEAGRGTRRVIVSCLHGNTINKGFRKRGIPRDGIRHVRYDGDNPNRWMKKFEDLF